MGTGSHVLRALTLASLCLAGCLDFVEPDLPERGAPAVLQLTIRLLETDTTSVEARLVPGLDDAGVPRRVTDSRLRVLGHEIEPDGTSSAGTRAYFEAWPGSGGDAAGPVEASGPGMEGLIAPAIRWYAMRRPGPPSVSLDPGMDLRLAVDVIDGVAEPEPGIRWWFLTLSDSTNAFRLGADGVPPDTIVVPARWVPSGDSIAALLIYEQSTRIDETRDYVGLVSLDARVSWVIRRPAANGEY